MEKIKGIPLSEGIAWGTVRWYDEEPPVIERIVIADEKIEEEKKRFIDACQAVASENEKLYLDACGNVKGNEADIFNAYRLLLEDEVFKEEVCGKIALEKVNAELAVLSCTDALKQQLKCSGDAVFEERAEDVEDIKQQLLIALGNNFATNREWDWVRGLDNAVPYVLMAEKLTPAKAIHMGQKGLCAIIVKNGTRTSHTAILARSMGIPAIAGIEPDIGLDGKRVIVDGTLGMLIVEPDEYEMEVAKQTIKNNEEITEGFNRMKAEETFAPGGKRLRIYANAGGIPDIKTALSSDAEGIGLLRSEFAYLRAPEEPDEELLYNEYKEAALLMGEKELVIRTLDIGADKIPLWMEPEKEKNPALWLRGIRYSLNNRRMFEIQLRAILRASIHGNISVLLPMVTDVDEVKETKEIINNIMKSFEKCGIMYKNVKIGVMIETPASVMISDLLAKEADFFSIGTNDLIQYTLAADRENDALDIFVKPRHEAVLRMIHMAVENAHRENCPVSICGEMAADYALTETFVKIGVDALSVSPNYLLGIRKKIKEIV